MGRRWPALSLVVAISAMACGNDTNVSVRDQGPDLRPFEGTLKDGALAEGKPDGRIVVADLSRADGAIVDGAIIKPDAPVIQPDSAVVKPDAPVVKPDAPVIPPDSAVVKPDAPVIPPDSAVVKPDAPVIPPDSAVVKPDAPVVKPDASAPTALTVLYGRNKIYSDHHDLNQVTTGRAPTPTAVAGMEKDLLLQDFLLAGLDQVAPADLSVATADLAELAAPGKFCVRVPKSDKRLCRWFMGAAPYGTKPPLPDRMAYVTLIQGGKISVLDKSAQGSDFSAAHSYAAQVAVSSDGKFAAAVKSSKQLLLLKLDGTTWSNGTAVLDVSDPTWGIKKVYAEGMVVIGKTLYAVGSDDAYSTGKRQLFSVALDGSGIATAIPLTGAPPYISEHLMVSADQSTIAFLAGKDKTSSSPVVYRLGQTPVTVGTAAEHVAPLAGYPYELMDNLNPGLALSPTGTWVAYATASGKAYVAKTDGTEVRALSDATLFSAVVNTYGAFTFVSDSDLLFFAGSTKTVSYSTVRKLDLFRYNVSGKSVTALTATGSNATTTAAPWGEGAILGYGAWYAPDGKQLFVIAGPSADAKLYAVDATSFAVQTVVSGGIDATSSMRRRISLAFYGDTALVRTGASGKLQQLYGFSQKSPKAATALVTIPSGATAYEVRDFKIAPNGASISFWNVGHTALYLIPLAGGTPTSIYTSTRSLTASIGYAWSPDSQSLVFPGAGKTSFNLVSVPATFGPVTVLDPTELGYFTVFSVGN